MSIRATIHKLILILGVVCLCQAPSLGFAALNCKDLLSKFITRIDLVTKSIDQLLATEKTAQYEYQNLMGQIEVSTDLHTLDSLIASVYQAQTTYCENHNALVKYLGGYRLTPLDLNY